MGLLWDRPGLPLVNDSNGVMTVGRRQLQLNRQQGPFNGVLMGVSLQDDSY